MSRLNKLTKGNTNVKKEKPRETHQTASKTDETRTGKTTSRLGRLAKTNTVTGKSGVSRKVNRVENNVKSPLPTPQEEERAWAKNTADAEKDNPQTPPESVTEEQQPRKSRLASLGVTLAEPERPLPLDEEIAQFQEDLDALEQMGLAKAPQLREGIVSVVSRIRTNDHLKEYMYENPTEMRKALIAFRAQFTKRHKATSERAKKASRKKAETGDFLKLAGL